MGALEIEWSSFANKSDDTKNKIGISIFFIRSYFIS
jgi:hypothetical protein